MEWVAEGEDAINNTIKENPLKKRCYVLSEKHLSGYRLIIGFDSLADCDAALDFVLTHRRTKEVPKPKPEGE